MSDCLDFAALVFCAWGAFSFSAALVWDLVLQAGAMVEHILDIGDDAMCRLHLTTGFALTGSFAVMGTNHPWSWCLCVGYVSCNGTCDTHIW